MNDRHTVMHVSAHANPPTTTRRDFPSANAETDRIRHLRPILRRQRGWSFLACSAPFCVFFLVLPGLAVAQSDPVTFIVTSDCHYDAFENEDRNQRVRDTLREMNEITGRWWPEPLGGGPITRPRGVLVLGDVIDDGDRKLEGRHQTPVQYGYFAADFGLDGTDGLLKYPAFEGWGNHDGPPEGKEKYGFSFQARLKKRNQIRREKGLISNVSENGLHYSWDWGNVHFVQLNLYPADRQREGVRYSADWHDPQGSLSFLKADLAEKVGQSGRPVVLMSHCGFDTDWWTPDDWREMYDSVASYHVVLYLYGHSGTGLRQWAPEGRTKKLQCVNTGQTENGFFVVEFTPRRVRLAYRVKTLEVVKEPDGKPRFEWDGSWQWKHLLEKPIARPAKTYRNPIIPHIGPADPAVVRYEGKYYLYPTWDGKGYDVFVSEDLVHWEQKPKCFTDPRGGAWAPDVFHHKKRDGKFYLYYTVNKPSGGKLIGVAAADRPLGPFVDRRTLVSGAIDAHLFQDDDGALYLYYVDITGGPFKILVQPMIDPLRKKGSPTIVLQPTDDWEKRRGSITEGPWMLKHSGVYYLMYSGSGADGPDYAIGYATSRSPTGPFTKYAGNPIAKRGRGVFGPGHHCVVTGPDGRLWMVYHQQNSEKIGWDRFLAIDPLWIDHEGVLHVKTTRGTDEPVGPKLIR